VSVSVVVIVIGFLEAARSLKPQAASKALKPAQQGYRFSVCSSLLMVRCYFRTPDYDHDYAHAHDGLCLLSPQNPSGIPSTKKPTSNAVQTTMKARE